MSNDPAGTASRAFPILGAIVLGLVLLAAGLATLMPVLDAKEADGVLAALKTIAVIVPLGLGAMLFGSGCMMLGTGVASAMRAARVAGYCVFAFLFAVLAFDFYWVAVVVLFGRPGPGFLVIALGMLITLAAGVFVVLWLQSMTDYLRRSRG